jgi:diamine N-acetyltransferase
VIQGQQTYLRPSTLDDIDFVFEWENNPEFWYYSEVQGPFSRQAVLEFLDTCGDLETHDQMRYIIFDKDDLPVGAIDLFHFDKALKLASIGIMVVDPANRRKGLANDALHALIAYLMDQKTLHELRSLIYSDNLPSLALFRKNGFRSTGKKLFRGKEAIQFVKSL